MEIRCRCTGCTARFKVDAKYAGKKARCPKCQAIVDVPRAGDESSSASGSGPPAPTAGSPTAPTPSTTSQQIKPKPGVTTTAIPVTRPAPTTPPPAAPAEPTGQMPSTVTTGTTGDFPSFTTKPAAGTSAQAGQKSPPRSRKKSSPLALVLGGGALLVIAAAAAGVYLATSGSQGDASGGGKGNPPASRQTTLHLDWQPSERSGGSLVIDGERRPVASAGELKIRLTPGEHKVVLLRRGYEPFEATVTLSKGQEQRLAPVWKESAVAVAPPAGTRSTTLPNPPAVTPPAGNDFPIGTAVGSESVRGFDGWLQMLDGAKRQAVREKKDLLIVFACSDAQRATQQLAAELEQAGVKNSHVCVVLDFPRTSAGLDVVADSAQNLQLASEFGVRVTPALALADEQGRPYFLKRDWDDGVEGMQARIIEWSKDKGQRDSLLAAARQGGEPERLAAAAKAVKWLQDKTVWRFYGQEIGQWMAAAERLDPENKQAVLEVFFEPQWFLNLVQINDEDTEAVVRTAGMLDPWVSRKFQDHDRGAKLHLVAAQLLAAVERVDDGLKHLEYAARYQPKDAEMAREVEAARLAIQNRDVLGNGTGFLVTADGYVLTNKHVADSPGRMEVKLPGVKETLPAQVVAKSETRDIALVKFTPPAGAPLPTLAISAQPTGRGKAVAAFGYPMARELGSGVKLTDGLITGLPDELNDSMFVLSVKINPGNSGGPLCDTRGNVVGMITAKTRADFLGAEDSYGLAIPAADLTAFLGQHLPAGAKLAAPDLDPASLSWDQVDSKVSGGVLMLVIKREK
jgi:S1-C subfamily serine protease